MKVLLVNHTGLMSGAEATTLDALLGLPPHVTPVLACPAGAFADKARMAGIDVRTLRGTSSSLRLHPLEAPRALAELVRFALDIRRMATESDAQVVHATSVRAALAGTLASAMGVRLVASLRDCLPPGAVSEVIKRLVDFGATAIVANSRYTARSWRDDRRGPPLYLAYPSTDLSRYAKARASGEVGRTHEGRPLLGVVAQITPWKGQDVAIRTLAGLKHRFPAAQLMIIGEAKFLSRATRYDNRAYEEGLHRLVHELGLDDSVAFLGQREDVPELLANLDALLLPSWEEPFGRVVIEAMAAGTPPLATSVGGTTEIITDRVDGRLLPPDREGPWIEAATELLADPEMCRRMAAEGRETAKRFSNDRQIGSILRAYQWACTTTRPRGVERLRARLRRARRRRLGR